MTTLRLAAMALALVCAIASPARAGSGFADTTLTDPVEGGPMPVIVFYPAEAPAGATTAVGPYQLAAVRDAPPAGGRYPLIVLSHGSGGTRLGHHDSLAALARAGFIAAAVEHPRDNYRDRSGLGTDRQLYGRAAHITALIDGILANPQIGPLVDAGRIGIAGFSAGGYTALVAVGARPDPGGFVTYCRAQPDDAVFCGGRSGPPPFSQPAPMRDARLRAAFVMAPGFGFLFDRAGLAEVDVPVRLYRAENDQVLREPWNAQRIADNLPRPPEYDVINGAGHYVFLVPCAPEIASRNAMLCVDPPGVDRTAIHRRLNDEMVDFFRRSLTS